MTGRRPVPSVSAMTTQAAVRTVRSPVGASKGGGQRAALAVAGFLGAFLVLNTYWALGGSWGVAWVVGCADCTVPLALVWMQEAAVLAGIAVVLARAGLWHPPLPDWIWRLGLWGMAAAFGAVGAQNLLGDNTLQARLLFAPLAIGLCVLCVVADRRLPKSGGAGGGR